MSFNKRNEITTEITTGKKAIYASFVCEEDDTYDYLLLEDIPRVVISPIEINSINSNTLEVNKTSVSFFTEFIEQNDPINIKIFACIDEFIGNPVLMEIQDFTDALCSTIYDNKIFEEHDLIKQAITQATNNLINDRFCSAGEIKLNHMYNTVGRVIDNNQNVIGIINNFNTSSNEKNELIIDLNEVVAYLSLKEMNLSKIEFCTGSAVLSINDFEIINNVEGIIKYYKIKVKKYSAFLSNEPIISETVLDIQDYDSYFDEKTSLLSDKNNIFENHEKTNNTISDLFDDFDF